MSAHRIGFLLVLSVALNIALFVTWQSRPTETAADPPQTQTRTSASRKPVDPKPLRETLRNLQAELKAAQKAHPDPIPDHDLIPAGWVGMPPFWKKSLLSAHSLKLRSTYVKNLGVTPAEQEDLEQLFRQHFRAVQEAEKRNAIRKTLANGTEVVEVSPAPDAFAQFLTDCGQSCLDLLGKERGYRLAQHLLAGEALWPVENIRRQFFVTNEGSKVRLAIHLLDQNGEVRRTKHESFKEGVSTAEHTLTWRYGHLLNLDRDRREVERSLP